VNEGKLVFAQVMQHLPLTIFRRCVAVSSLCRGEHKIKSFSCPGPDPVDGLCAVDLPGEPARHRSVSACPAIQALSSWDPLGGGTKHAGQCQHGARLAHICRLRSESDWHCPAPVHRGALRCRFEGIGRRAGYDDDRLVPVGVSLAPFRSAKAAVKLHTLLDLRGNIPAFIHISNGKMHDVNVLDHLLPEPGAFYIMDRGFIDFERLHRFHEAGSFFVTRGKSNLKVQRRYSHSVDRSTGLICGQTVTLTRFYSHKGFETPLHRIRFKDPQTEKFGDVRAHTPIGTGDESDRLVHPLARKSSRAIIDRRM
jgi:hypothetical protein